jgi:hypothetical protein
MRKLRARPSPRNGELDSLPLFRWALNAETPAVPFPVRHVARRCGLPLHRARLVAQLAGFRWESDR